MISPLPRLATLTATACLPALLLMAPVPNAAALAPPASAPQARAPELAPAPARAVRRAAPAARVATADDSDRSCKRTRRKLWVEDEGWVVRRIAICA